MIGIFNGFECMATKYVFLTCTVAVVEIEESAAMLPKLKSIDQYDPQFLTIK